MPSANNAAIGLHEREAGRVSLGLELATVQGDLYCHVHGPDMLR